ncbi:MAG: glutamine synthetase family protein [Anaerolineae bacterium]
MTEFRDAADVMKAVADQDVSFIHIWFTDVLGLLKSFAITPAELEGAFAEGMGFDGSSIEGFARIEESDMIAMPDPTTCQVLPWRPKDRPVLRMFCDLLQPDGTPYAGDPRYALKRALAKADAAGYTYYVGPELEYFYFADDSTPTPLDKGGYFDAQPLDSGADLRRATIFTLQEMGIDVEYSHHEVAPSQHEIDLRFAEGLSMADTAVTFRVAVKEIARQHGVHATFMPKPMAGENGSGMHTHQSLFRGERNAFFDADDEYNLSDIGKSYIAGTLKYAREMAAVTNQWVNSYKRLVPGFEAPVYLSWARRNRSAMVRVPMYKPGKEQATRMEFRSPDPACNPYLAFACMLSAGLKGVENQLPLAEPIERDVYEMNGAERGAAGIGSLPGNLFEAIQELQGSQLVREALGDHIFEKLLTNKLIEWDDYRLQVTDFEIERYLPRL